MPLTRAELKILKSLRAAEGRATEGLFAAEGVRLLEEAVRHRFPPRRVFFAGSALSARGRELLDALAALGLPCVEVSAGQIEAFADTKEPQGIAAVFALPGRGLAALGGSPPARLLVCEGVSDPGNLGTLVRSALAFGCSGAVLCGPCADPYGPKVVRATAGAIFGVRVVVASSAELLAYVAARDYRVVAASGAGTSDLERLRAASRGARVAVAVGAEAEGLSAEILASADVVWRIRHSDRVDSLNAAVAGSIILREVYEAGAPDPLGRGGRP